MKKINSKYNSSLSHRKAILHMIGQSVEVFREYVKIADVASWMNVSKPTARKHLHAMWLRGEIRMWHIPYKNTIIYMIDLTDEVKQQYEDKDYEIDYRMYAQRVMKAILQ